MAKYFVHYYGLFVEYAFWTSDWWHPITITGTRVGIEDLIMCFTHVGIPIFLYPYCFGRTAEVIQSELFSKKVWHLALFLAVFFSLLLSLFYSFHLHSFYATSWALFITTLLVILLRRDLLVPALLSGSVMLTVTLPIYMIGNLLSPNIIEALWNIRPLGAVYAGVPVEDAIWYFLVGAFFLAGYAFVSHRKFIPVERGLFSDIRLVFSALTTRKI